MVKNWGNSLVCARSTGKKNITEFQFSQNSFEGQIEGIGRADPVRGP